MSRPAAVRPDFLFCKNSALALNRFWTGPAPLTRATLACGLVTILGRQVTAPYCVRQLTRLVTRGRIGRETTGWISKHNCVLAQRWVVNLKLGSIPINCYQE